MIAGIDWFVRSVQRDSQGLPGPAPEWPMPGGLAAQDPRVVEMYDILREEIKWVGVRQAATA
jgi:hypothetical protein